MRTRIRPGFMYPIGFLSLISLFCFGCSTPSPIRLKTKETYLGKPIEGNIYVKSWKGPIARTLKECLSNADLPISKLLPEALSGKLIFEVQAEGSETRLAHLQLFFSDELAQQKRILQKCGEKTISEFNRYSKTLPQLSIQLGTLTIPRSGTVEIHFPFRVEEIQNSSGEIELKLTPINTSGKSP